MITTGVYGSWRHSIHQYKPRQPLRSSPQQALMLIPRKDNGCGFTLRQDLINCLEPCHAGNVNHLSPTGKNAPETNQWRQRILMEDGNACAGTDAERLQTRAYLSALQVKSAKIDALVRKNVSGLSRKALSGAGDQVE